MSQEPRDSSPATLGPSPGRGAKAVTPRPSPAERQVALFATRNHTGAIRTSGVVVVATSIVEAESSASLVAHLAAVIPADATGKVAVVVPGRRPQVVVFQNCVDGRPRLAWCGNAVAAAGAFIKAEALDVHGPGGRRVDVELAPDCQLWRMRGALPQPCRYTLANGTDLWITGVFNQYVAVVHPTPAPAAHDNGKCVVIDLSGHPPAVVFHTTLGGRQAAPLTGLAELRMLASVEPFMPLAAHGEVRLPSGEVERLPALHVSRSEFGFVFPTRLVELTHVELDR